jgi:hypothetical protein
MVRGSWFVFHGLWFIVRVSWFVVHLAVLSVEAAYDSDDTLWHFPEHGTFPQMPLRS